MCLGGLEVERDMCRLMSPTSCNLLGNLVRVDVVGIVSRKRNRNRSELKLSA